MASEVIMRRLAELDDQVAGVLFGALVAHASERQYCFFAEARFDLDHAGATFLGQGFAIVLHFINLVWKVFGAAHIELQ